MGLVWEEPTGCRKSQRCDLGAQGHQGPGREPGLGARVTAL